MTLGDILFIDALGTGSIKKITKVVDRAYTPKIAVTDLDILDDHYRLKYLLKSLEENIEYNDIEYILDERREVEEILHSNSLEWTDAKERGIEGLPSKAQERCRQILEDVRGLGLFIVPVGELENWMDLGVSKQRWGPKALEKISEGDCDPDLIRFVSDMLERIEDQHDQMVPDAD